MLLLLGNTASLAKFTISFTSTSALSNSTSLSSFDFFLGAKKFRKNARVVKVVDGFRWVRWGNIRFCKEKATRRDEINGGDGGGGDGGDDDGRILPGHPGPIIHAPRDIISRKGKSLTPI